MPSVIGATQLKARLQSDPEGAYLFFGEEEHLKRVYLSRFRALITDNPEFNVTVLNLQGQEDPVRAIASEFSRPPFLSELRFLDVRGLELHKLSAGETRAFCRLLTDCPPGLVAVFYFFECDIPFSSNIPHTQKRLAGLEVYKNLPENVTVVHFAHPTLRELCAYYAAKFKSRGVQASDEVLSLFCTRGAQDMTLLENESEKLIALSRGQSGVLTRDMVDEALPEVGESMLYKLTDAIESCDAARSLKEYRILRTMKFEPIPILASIARSLGNLHLMKSGVTDSEAEKQFGLKSFRARSLREKSRSMSERALSASQQKVLETDRKLKSTALPADVILEALIVELCGILGGAL